MNGALAANVIGTAAGLCSMWSFVPQLIKIIHEKTAEAVSLNTYLFTVAAFVLWVVYGMMLHSWPVAVSNGVNLILAAAILTLKWRYGRR